MNGRPNAARIISGVLALAVTTGLCLGGWVTITQNPAVAGMWFMVYVVIIVWMLLGGRNGR